MLQGLLTDLKSAFGDKKSPTGGQVNNSRPDLLSLEHPQETHPAGFAATKVLNYAPVDETPSSRRKKETKLLQEDQAAVEQGKASPWQEFVVRRRKVGSHSPAFDKDETSYGTIDAIHMPYCGGTVVRAPRRARIESKCCFRALAERLERGLEVSSSD